MPSMAPTKYSTNTSDPYQAQKRVVRKLLESYQKSRSSYKCYIREQIMRILIHLKRLYPILK